MTPTELQAKVSKMPSQPGIYIFKGLLGKKLYVGKAARLRNRLLSYLKSDDRRIKAMIDKSTSLDYHITHSDIEALILESQFIKNFHPEFNIMLRDDKQYFYVGFTDNDYPQIFLSHQTDPFKTRRRIEFIGPFTDGAALKTTIRFIRKIFPYCTCKQKHNVFCLNYHIGKCLGYCCLKNPGQSELALEKEKEYRRNIKAIKSILNGERVSLIKNLEKEMKNLAKNGKLEEALAMRNRLEQLKRIFENAKIIQDNKFHPHPREIDEEHMRTLKALKEILNLKKIPKTIEGYDISNIQGSFATGALVRFEGGYPNKNGYRKFRIKYTPEMSNDTAMLREVLERRFAHSEWKYPDLILVDGGKGQLNAVSGVVRKHRKTLPVIALTKNEFHRGDHLFSSSLAEPIELKSLPRAVNNLIILIDAEAHRFAISYYRKRHKKSLI